MSGDFRAAIFGANDGLVSNLSLVLGMVGTGVSASVVLVTGIAPTGRRVIDGCGRVRVRFFAARVARG